MKNPAMKILLGASGLAAVFVIFWPRRASAATAPASTAPQGCVPPVVGQRWNVCSPTGNQVSTVSQGNFDALYDRKTRLFLAVVDNTTYDDAGAAVVVPRASAPWAADSLPAI
jgi:hypothetical protein